MKILVVDDEKLLVKGMKFNLENEGYEVECAYNGAAAVELAREGKFDLIILDVMMPEVDGLEACMRIREFSNVPVIMLTAQSDKATVIETAKLGIYDYMLKPFAPQELLSRVRGVLEPDKEAAAALVAAAAADLPLASGASPKPGPQTAPAAEVSDPG